MLARETGKGEWILGMGTVHMVAVVPCCKKALVSTAQMTGGLVYMADVVPCCEKALVSTAQMAGGLVYMADVVACCIIAVKERP